MPALELGGITLGVREGVIVLITLVAVYMVFVLLRMRRLRQKPAPVTAPMVAPVVAASPPSEDIPVLSDVESAPFIAEQVSAFDDEVDPPWGQTSSELSADMLRRGLELEVAQLRDEVDAIRGELAALRQDLQQEVAHLHSAQAVSPVYGDAMQMAAAGYDPAAIADRCGIARAEAELVVALAKSQMQ